ncbi:hypothetical protein FOXB_09203 [Fusarium oxysporum f. sp. conglutinans Fo5176]|uniref:Uncharacterized protein n=1 Tax=Fusarium oxysporum (strain Fo5176) TaxID=660025 RepID=F9FS22_FUSOF|nr:hypothetical protein FOXB_09203 [Fusarium oxysporum f. sp. conglutinans Fo5176]
MSITQGLEPLALEVLWPEQQTPHIASYPSTDSPTDIPQCPLCNETSIAMPETLKCCDCRLLRLWHVSLRLGNTSPLSIFDVAGLRLPIALQGIISKSVILIVVHPWHGDQDWFAVNAGY